VSRFLTRILFLPLAVSTIVFGCKDDSSGPDGGGGQGGEGGLGGYGGGSSAVTSVRGTIGPEGGRLRTSNVSLFVPSGALTRDKTITVTELDAAAIAALPATSDGIKMAGIPAKFEPHGLAFQEPADIILGYNEPTNKSEPLAVLKLDNDQDPTWEYVPGAKFESGSASLQVDGFSIYCVFHDPDGVADMIYGPEQPGSGGTGSGGQGSGGETSTGGTGGGTGGSAGGGGDPNLPGYLYTPNFHGFGDTLVGPNAALETTDLTTEPGPNCVTGTTGANSDDVVTLFYNVNQDADASAAQPTSVTGAGLRLDLEIASYRHLRVELSDGQSNWCANIAPEVSGPYFLSWDSFNPYNCPTYYSEYNFDPATDELLTVGVTVLSEGSAGTAFGLCLQELDAGSPNGYMSGPTWMGYGFTGYGGVATITSDLYDVPAPNCIDGTTDSDLASYAELGYYLNQDVHNEDLGDVFLGGSGLAFDLIVDPERALEFHMWSATTEYCSGVHFAVPSGPLDVVPWSEFVNCSASTDFFIPGNTPINRISVRVLSQSVADDPYKLCIESMAEAP